MTTKKFRIDYINADKLLRTEYRTHETGVEPSDKMVRNCLHTICLENGITDFSKAKATVSEMDANGVYQLKSTYILITRGLWSKFL